jgi:hypothetical protein
MPASALDPSLALGFLCRSPSDLAQLCVLLRGVFDTHQLPLFEVGAGGAASRGAPSLSVGSEDGAELSLDAPNAVAAVGGDSGGASGSDGDEFVLL